jgi:DNA processing protein
MTEREAYIALNLMEKVGPVSVRSLRESLGSAAAIFEASDGLLQRSRGVGPATADAILSQRAKVDWRGEIERAGEKGLRLVTPMDPEYPAALGKIHDPPLALYVMGALESRDSRAIAIVGTRRPTHYGREVAGSLAWQLAGAGYTVVSGLALGIDTAAHQGALKAKGRTLAVIGGGFHHLYPETNRELAEAIAHSGAVLSELPLDRTPDKTTFPMRNRIVSGLSAGVILVEAGVNSGALITVNQALEQGRTVFAVPGRIDSPASHGPNDLIKNGAKLIVHAQDVLDEFADLFPTVRRAPSASGGAGAGAASLSPDERKVLDALEAGEKDVDSLIRECGIGAAAMGSLLVGLELARRIRMLPGRVVEAVRR